MKSQRLLNLHGNNSGAKHPSRIEFRNEVQELPCTAALTDRVPMYSKGMEFFDYHVTDDIWYHNTWKNTVAPECHSR